MEPGPVEQDRPESPPPLEANDQLVTAIFTAAWAVALIVLLIVRTQLPASSRWWIWTCAAGLVMGLFGLWYVPRLKTSRTRAAARRAQAETALQTPHPAPPDPHPAPQDSQ